MIQFLSRITYVFSSSRHLVHFLTYNRTRHQSSKPILFEMVLYDTDCPIFLKGNVFEADATKPCSSCTYLKSVPVPQPPVFDANNCFYTITYTNISSILSRINIDTPELSSSERTSWENVKFELNRPLSDCDASGLYQLSFSIPCILYNSSNCRVIAQSYGGKG